VIQKQSVDVFLFCFNQEKYITERLESIVTQEKYIKNITVVNDASSDGTRSELYKFISDLHPYVQNRISLINSKVSSGKPAGRWSIIATSKSPYTWICEGDDVSDKNFLIESLKALENLSGVGFAWSWSKLIDSNSKLIGYDIDVHQGPRNSQHLLFGGIKSGRLTIENDLIAYNPFPNISAILFDTSILQKSVKELESKFEILNVVSDWYLYSRILKDSDFVVVPKSLNSFRRHADSRSASHSSVGHYLEAISAQNYAALLVKGEIDSEKVKVERQKLALNLGISATEVRTSFTNISHSGLGEN
jgi:glycosyltransferase involved in cell wall biosynthesis